MVIMSDSDATAPTERCSVSQISASPVKTAQKNSSMQEKALAFATYAWSLTPPPNCPSSGSSKAKGKTSDETETASIEPSLASNTVSTSIGSSSSTSNNSSSSSITSTNHAGVGQGIGIVTYDTTTFRRMTNLLHPQDMVIEMGCSYGKATTLIRYVNRLIGRCRAGCSVFPHAFPMCMHMR